MGTREFLMHVALGTAVFLGCMLVDVAAARFVVEVNAGRRVRAAWWSVAQWCAGMVGFAVAVKVSLWYAPIEAAGLFVGTLIGTRKDP